MKIKNKGQWVETNEAIDVPQISKKGMTMEYKDADGHFSCKDVVSEKTATSMFTDYLPGKNDWKAKCEWGPFE